MSTKSKDNAAAAGRDLPHLRDANLSSENRFLTSLRLELAWLSGRHVAEGAAASAAPGWFCGSNGCGRGAPARFQPLRSHEITPEFLDRTIRALKRWKFDIVSMDEVCHRAVTSPTPRRFVALTFDGGYKDMIASAYPVLSRHGVPFTVYLPTAFPDRLGEAWWLALEAVIARESRISLVMDRQERHFDIAEQCRKIPALRISLGLDAHAAAAGSVGRDQRSLQAILGRPRDAVARGHRWTGTIWQNLRPIRW